MGARLATISAREAVSAHPGGYGRRTRRIMSEHRMLNEYPRLRGVLLACATIVLVVAAARSLGAAAGVIRPVLIPLAVAVLVTGLLMPVQILFNHRLRLPRSVAASLTLITTAMAVAGILYLSGHRLALGVADVAGTAAVELAEIKSWLDRSPIPLGQQDIDQAIDAAIAWIQDNGTRIAQGAIGAGSSAASLTVGTLLTVVATYFFLAQGDRIFASLTFVLPEAWRERAFESGRRGWVTLGTYTKTQALLSAADAIGIGVGAAVLGLPFVLPLVAITFVLCFIPVLGAVISGALVVLVALAYEGVVTAVVMLGIVVIVQQGESSVLGPILMGKAVSLHPLAVLVSVLGGSYVFGLIGALFAVPVVATLKTILTYLSGHDPFPGLDSGGSALRDRPKRLASDMPAVGPPRALGTADLRWPEGARRPRVERPAPSASTTPGGDEELVREEPGPSGGQDVG